MPEVRSSLGLPCDMSSCWKNPASAGGLDPKALPPKCQRTPRLSWVAEAVVEASVRGVKVCE
jgi:hypothetical protein